MTTSTPAASDVNLLASWLANLEITSLNHLPNDQMHRKICLIICGSAIFHCFERVYAELRAHPTRIQGLILCGGVGHSTPHLYSAVKHNSRYSHLYDWLVGEQKSEAEFMYAVLGESGTLKKLQDVGVKVAIETKSTNCGANAIEARRVMRDVGLDGDGMELVVVQDPTMSLRTMKCFEQTYINQGRQARRLVCYPTFVPKVKEEGDHLVFDVQSMGTSEVWDMDRFVGLLLGEVPRLRPTGYGPQGAGFIPEVRIPKEVEEAWARLDAVTKGKR